MRSIAKQERRCTLLASAVLLLIGASNCGAQQANYPTLPANLDQSVLQHRVTRSAPNAGTVTAAPEDLTNARLSPGYLLQMEVYETPEMSSTLRVDNLGDVSVPLVPDPVHLEGDTLVEAQNEIAKALIKAQILNAPQVTLNILQFATQSATVLGEVESPGRVQLLAERSLAEVLALVGGETAFAGNTIDIQRGAIGETREHQVHVHQVYAAGQDSALLNNTRIYPGDTITVQRAGAIYVLGGVTRPGGYLMVDAGSLNILQAVALAQGTLLRAEVGTVEVMRRDADGYKQLKVPLAKMQKGDVPPLHLRAEDIVYVPISHAKSVLLDGATLIAAAGTASVYAFR